MFSLQSEQEKESIVVSGNINRTVVGSHSTRPKSGSRTFSSLLEDEPYAGHGDSSVHQTLMLDSLWARWETYAVLCLAKLQVQLGLEQYYSFKHGLWTRSNKDLVSLFLSVLWEDQASGRQRIILVFHFERRPIFAQGPCNHKLIGWCTRSLQWFSLSPNDDFEPHLCLDVRFFRARILPMEDYCRLTICNWRQSVIKTELTFCMCALKLHAIGNCTAEERNGAQNCHQMVGQKKRRSSYP
jgi:hypothetical protein